MAVFPGFEYREHQLFVEDVCLRDIANAYSTPCYVYSVKALRQRWKAYQQAFSKLRFTLCYAVKANSNLNILRLLASWDCGFDIVSIGELERVLLAGAKPEKIVFSGVSKRSDEIVRALHAGIHCINVESASELQQIAAIATQLGKVAPVSLRVNPNVDANTHPYISTGLKENKFGIDINAVLPLYIDASRHKSLQPIGVSCHIGSQITDLGPFEEAAKQVLNLLDKLRQEGIELQHVDLGGGLGIQYRDEVVPDVSAYADRLHKILATTPYHLMLEPGRSLIGNAGVLLTRIEHIKETACKKFALVDAGMNDLMRPSLYQAWHEIWPLSQTTAIDKFNYDVVGPVCESGDFLAADRMLPVLAADDVIAVMSAGAYGMTMASRYNSRPLPAELLVDGSEIMLIRRRESLEQLWENELLAGE